MPSDVPRAHAATRTLAVDAITEGRGELFGAPVELVADIGEIRDPKVDRSEPGGLARLVADRDSAVVHVAGIGAFRVERGAHVRVALERDADAEAASRWLNSTVAALLLAQRGEFALHASAVRIEDAGVALCGPSGVGKSTTALRLRGRGHSLVTDDVSVLTPGETVMVRPLAHPVRVLPESAARLGIDVSEALRVPSRPKLVLPPPRAEPVELAAIVVLEPQDGPVRTSPMWGTQAHWQLVRNVHRGELYRRLWEIDMFRWASRVAAAVPVHRIMRPRAGWSVDAVGDAVEGVADGAVAVHRRRAP